TIRRLAKERHLGILFSSHLLSDVEALSDRVALMMHGHLEHVVSMAELKTLEDVHYVLTVNDLEQAYDLLMPFLKAGRIERLWSEGTVLHVSFKAKNQEAAADVVHMLVDQGIRLYEMRRIELKLEDLFRHWTTKKEPEKMTQCPG
ncbi:MAG: hypothetical protein RBR24_09895, partial [Candidatus Carbobacillus sp.]|nr:hypothetical protein [Candidatus Carbobacillus sp.]